MDKDKFLGRGKGSRGAVKNEWTKDTSLGHYLPLLDKDVFIVFHSLFSENPEFPMFALKVLSCFMGFLPIQFNANKIMLLEKTCAMRIFGYGPGFWASRAGYFLCYASYALAHEETDVNRIGGYSRKKFLRYRGNIPDDKVVKKLKKT